MKERIQKIMAHAGIASRRASEELIRQGRVTVNGQVAQIGQKADPDRDQIMCEGKPVRPVKQYTYIALYKPRGVLSDHGDPTGRLRTATDLVPDGARLYPVGRLDLISEGLLLLTDDGDLTYHLTHPRYEHEKEYHVLVGGQPNQATLDKWREGIPLDGQQTVPARVSVIRNERHGTWLCVVLREGRKRQIRRVSEQLGYHVQRLVRVRICSLALGNLRSGQWRELTQQEVRALKRETKQKKKGGRR